MSKGHRNLPGGVLLVNQFWENMSKDGKPLSCYSKKKNGEEFLQKISPNNHEKGQQN